MSKITTSYKMVQFIKLQNQQCNLDSLCDKSYFAGHGRKCIHCLSAKYVYFLKMKNTMYNSTTQLNSMF